jgi:hypothetical protein
MTATFDQQPISRTVGKRIARDGRELDASDRAAMARMAQYRTRAPKGVFRYDSHDQMQADWLAWQVAAVVARQRGE